MYYNDGRIYSGQWQDDRYHGRGIMKLSEEAAYEGRWDAGKEEKAEKTDSRTPFVAFRGISPHPPPLLTFMLVTYL